MKELMELFQGFSVNVNLLWYALGVLIICDFATGIAKAYRKDKYVLSSKLRDGGFKKCGMLSVALLGIGLSYLFGDSKLLISNGIVAYYVYTELVSVIENLDALGIPLPPVIKNITGSREKSA